MKKSIIGLALAAMLIASCGSDTEDTSDALSSVCDSQATVGTNLEALAALDPATSTTGEYRSALETLQDSVDELREARSELTEQDVANLETAYDALRSDLEELDDVALAEADATISAASDAQIQELSDLYDAAYASSSCG